ncbi:SDR family oxidoreductase [bacterium]|nr:MAG: SDR family oxidoreductase [bacterium]
MRNLVTGGAGFIGSHLCRALLDKGEEVICLDNLSSGQIRNVQVLEAYARFSFIESDITDHIQIEVDRIYNLACPASPPFYQSDPIKTTKTSVLGSLNLLELAATSGARILQASTSEIYGDPLEHPQSETYWGNVNPIGIRSCYDEGKRVAETLFFDYMRQEQVEIKVVRIFNTYGPNMRPDDGRVISNFITQALTNQPLTVHGSGQQTRSFCYVDDLVKGLISVMNSAADLTGPFNLGNPNEFKIIELVELIRELIGEGIQVTFRPLPQDDPKQRRPDINLAFNTLGWQPVVALEDGLPQTIAYFKERIASV